MAARPQKARSGDSKNVVILFSSAWSGEFAVLAGPTIRPEFRTNRRNRGSRILPTQSCSLNKARPLFGTSAQLRASKTVEFVQSIDNRERMDLQNIYRRKERQFLRSAKAAGESLSEMKENTPARLGWPMAARASMQLRFKTPPGVGPGSGAATGRPAARAAASIRVVMGGSSLQE